MRQDGQIKKALYIKKFKKLASVAVIFLAAFVLWTILVKIVDVKAIGPNGSSVGFALLNGAFHELTGVHWMLYDITDVMIVLPFAIVFIFGVTGLCQWIKRKNLLKVDADIIALGIFYIIVLMVYLFFQKVVIDYRPVLIEGELEASYPSSTTVISICVMTTAIAQFRVRLRGKKYKKALIWIVALIGIFMTVARIISGVHWITDIMGGALISLGLVYAYFAACAKIKSCNIK